MRYIYSICIGLIFIHLSCKERYFPNVISSGIGYLVVEGVLNASHQPTIIKITRTQDLNTKAGQFQGETNAVVTVEGNDNSVKTLAMTEAGTYQNSNLDLSVNNEYRLRIKTMDGKEYLSDYVKVKITPEIDSIGYKFNVYGAQLYVNTHDATNNTRYYRWSYDETWEINSYFSTNLIYEEGPPSTVRDRNRDEMVFRCWKYGKSNSLLFGSSAKLREDVIFEQPIQTIPYTDERLSVRYSILLKQYSLDKGAYEFFDLMKKNTESIGTVFDPQPSEIRGNIKCITAPDDIVIGYVCASTVAEKRVFFTRPLEWRFQMNCETISIPTDSIDYFFKGEQYMPVLEESGPGGNVIAYISSSGTCVDCQKRGGNVKMPEYW